MIRLTGFGPFGAVRDNPSAALVRALAGRTIAGHRVEVHVLPVRWRGGLDRALACAPSDPVPVLLLGFGVATTRTGIEVEAAGIRAREGLDADGQPPPPAPDGPDRVDATIDVARLARCLDAGVSHDAGTYLCNAWAFEVVARAPCPAAFVHIPPGSADPAEIAAGVAHYLAREG